MKQKSRYKTNKKWSLNVILMSPGKIVLAISRADGDDDDDQHAWESILFYGYHVQTAVVVLVVRLWVVKVTCVCVPMNGWMDDGDSSRREQTANFSNKFVCMKIERKQPKTNG